MLNKLLLTDLKNIKYFLTYDLLKIRTYMRLYGAKNIKMRKKCISFKLLLLLQFLSYSSETLQKGVLGNCAETLGAGFLNFWKLGHLVANLCNFFHKIATRGRNFQKFKNPAPSVSAQLPNNHSCKVSDL